MYKPLFNKNFDQNFSAYTQVYTIPTSKKMTIEFETPQLETSFPIPATKKTIIESKKLHTPFAKKTRSRKRRRRMPSPKVLADSLADQAMTRKAAIEEEKLNVKIKEEEELVIKQEHKTIGFEIPQLKTSFQVPATQKMIIKSKKPQLHTPFAKKTRPRKHKRRMPSPKISADALVDQAMAHKAAKEQLSGKIKEEELVIKQEHETIEFETPQLETSFQIPATQKTIIESKKPQLHTQFAKKTRSRKRRRSVPSSKVAADALADQVIARKAAIEEEHKLNVKIKKKELVMKQQEHKIKEEEFVMKQQEHALRVEVLKEQFNFFTQLRKKLENNSLPPNLFSLNNI